MTASMNNRMQALESTVGERDSLGDLVIRVIAAMDVKRKDERDVLAQMRKLEVRVVQLGGAIMILQSEVGGLKHGTKPHA